MTESERDALVYQAKLSEQVERFDDMMEDMTAVVTKFEKHLSVEERNLLSVAFKNVIGAKRASWRILSSLEGKLEEKDEQKKKLLSEYKKIVEKELDETSNKIVGLIDEYLLKKEGDQPNEESRIFYLKMKGDYKRYLAEFQTGGFRDEATEASLKSYSEASSLASDKLAPTHPIRLGLALNFSVFYYEIVNSPDRACRLAKAAFDDAIAELDTLSEESYKDSTLIMQLLRDNLTLWTSDIEHAEGDNGDLEDLEAKDGEC